MENRIKNDLLFIIDYSYNNLRVEEVVKIELKEIVGHRSDYNVVFLVKSKIPNTFKAQYKVLSIFRGEEGKVFSIFVKDKFEVDPTNFEEEWLKNKIYYKYNKENINV